MRRIHLAAAVAIVFACAALVAVGSNAAKSSRDVSIPANVDVSQRHLNESEEAIAVNPTNPNNIVIVSNVGHREAGLSAGMFEGVSFDGGATWTTHLIGNNDNLGDACCDPTLSFDQYGNLFMSYLYETENAVPVALSTDGGLTFKLVANIAAPPKGTPTKAAGDNRGLFRFVDQPTITTGAGEVWVVVNAGGPIVATGAAVSGFGQVGSFAQVEVVAGTNNCTYGDVAIGPAGQVMQVCTLTESGQGGGKIYVNVDPDGLGPAGFGAHSIFVVETHVGGFDFIPPQPDRSVDAEPGLAWDRTGGPHNGRVYLVYTLEQKNESDNTDVYVRYSNDNGANWSAPVRVNDDATTKRQFLPKISLDPTTGNIVLIWYDARNDLGTGGPGDTNGLPNDDAQFWCAFSADGQTFSPNIQISAGTSNSRDSGNGIDYGDYTGLSFFGGIAHPAWSDNSTSTGNNPDGALHQLDIYTAAVPVS